VENAGTCLPVQGAPHGPLRAACESSQDICAAKACDGKERLSCEAFSGGSEIQCSPARCEGSSFYPASGCDGNGSCALAPEIRCGQYACAMSGCRTTCRTSVDCSRGYVCRGERCVSGAQCLDETHSIGADGVVQDCGANICRSDGACGTGCATSADCAPSYVCDGEQRQCIAATPDAGSTQSEGCGCRLAGERASSDWSRALALCGALAMLTRRRRSWRAALHRARPPT
jgi:hypothetical protein